MRRITTWLAITLAVVGFAVYYQVSLASDGHEPPRAGSAEESEHSGKPGENKD